MDSHLKQFFDDQQGFIRLTLGGLEERLTNRLENFESKVMAGFQGVDSRLSAHDQQFVGISRRLDAMDQQFVGINRRLDVMDRRFDGIDGRLDGMDARFGRIESDLDEIKRNVRLLVGRKSARPRKPRR